MTRTVPSFEITSRLVARALGLAQDALHTGFRPATATDLPAILALRKRTRWDDAAYLVWRYGIGSAEHTGAILWVLRDGERLYGMLGTEPVTMRADSERIEGCLVMDLQVDPTCEDLGVSTWMNQALFARNRFTLAVGANSHSIGLVKGLFHALPNRSLWMLPLDFRNWLAARKSNARFAWVAGSLANIGWPVWRWLRRPWIATDIELRVIPQFSDALLAPLQDAPSTKIEIFRSAHRMNWRLLKNPRAQYQVVGAFRGSQCLGYVALRVELGPMGSSAMHMIDWLVSGTDADAVLSSLLAEVVRRARAARCASVQTIMLDRDGEGVLARNGFLRGRSSDHLVCGIHSKDPAFVELALRSDWRITDLTFDDDGCY